LRGCQDCAGIAWFALRLLTFSGGEVAVGPLTWRLLAPAGMGLPPPLPACLAVLIACNTEEMVLRSAPLPLVAAFHAFLGGDYHLLRIRPFSPIPTSCRALDSPCVTGHQIPRPVLLPLPLRLLFSPRTGVRSRSAHNFFNFRPLRFELQLE